MISVLNWVEGKIGFAAFSLLPFILPLHPHPGLACCRTRGYRTGSPLPRPKASPWDHRSSICIKQANKSAKETSPAEILWLLISKNINSSPSIQNKLSSHQHGRWAHPWCVDLSPLSGCLSSFHGFKSLLRAYDCALEASCQVLSLRSSLFIFICPLDISTWMSNRQSILHKIAPKPCQQTRVVHNISPLGIGNLNKKKAQSYFWPPCFSDTLRLTHQKILPALLSKHTQNLVMGSKAHWSPSLHSSAAQATVIAPQGTPHLPPHSSQTIPFQTHHSSASNRPVLLFPSRLDMLWTPGPSPTSSLTQPTIDTLATLAFCPRVLRQPALAAWNSTPTQDTNQMSPS